MWMPTLFPVCVVGWTSLFYTCVTGIHSEILSAKIILVLLKYKLGYIAIAILENELFDFVLYVHQFFFLTVTLFWNILYSYYTFFYILGACDHCSPSSPGRCNFSPRCHLSGVDFTRLRYHRYQIYNKRTILVHTKFKKILVRKVSSLILHCMGTYQSLLLKTFYWNIYILHF